MSPGSRIAHTQPKVLNRVLARFEPGEELAYVETFEAPYAYARRQRLAYSGFNNRSLSASRSEAKMLGSWRTSGVPDPTRWIDAGATPAQASEWHAAGIDVSRFAQVGRRGWNLSETLEWMLALRWLGLSGALAAHDLGRTPAQMSPPV